MKTIDYNVWQEFADGPWYWEVVNVPDDYDGTDEVLESGIADTKEKAMEQAKAAIRKHR
jgi:hypothetical protein